MGRPASRSDDRTNLIGRWCRRSPRPVVEDPEWAIATSVPIRQREDGQGGGTAGRISARRHPTGWFICAIHPADLSAEQLSDLRHFVCVRVYLLLRNGPVPGTWDRGSESGEWVADLAVDARSAPDVPELFGQWM